MSDVVTIVIPVYNGENYIEDAINSTLSQSYKNLDIIIVDDGSTDDTVSILKKYEDYDNRIRVAYRSHKGVSAARNSGIDIARGDFIVFLDADDWMESNAIVELVKEREKQFLVALKETTVQNRKIDFSTCVVNNVKTINREQAIAALSKNQYSMQSSCAKLFDLDIINKYHIRFDEGIVVGEDGLFVISYLAHFRGLKFIDSDAWKIYLGEGSASRSDFSKKLITALAAIEKMFFIDGLTDKEIKLIGEFMIKKGATLLVRYVNSDYCDNRDVRSIICFLWKGCYKNRTITCCVKILGIVGLLISPKVISRKIINKFLLIREKVK